MWLKESKEYKEKLDRIYKEEPEKLSERNWKHKVPMDLARKFAKQINSNNPDFEEIREVLKEIITFAKNAVGEDDFYEEDLLDDLEFADLETDEDVDYYIDEMYDVLDGYNIWMEPASWFDFGEDEEEEEDDEEDDDEDLDESCEMKESENSLKDLHNVFAETVYDWKESGEKISPRLKDFSRKVIAGCILEDDEILKKIAYDYADVQEIAPPLYDALMNHLKSDNLEGSKMKEANYPSAAVARFYDLVDTYGKEKVLDALIKFLPGERIDEFVDAYMKDLDIENSGKFAIQYYDVDKEKAFSGDVEENSFMTEDSWTTDIRDALLFDTREEAQKVLDETDEYYKDSDPDYPVFKMRVVSYEG